MRVPMLLRFSLYGFLKNQQYYEPFIILVFLEKGLSFAAIGLLIGFRELAVNVMEVPSGVVADMYGRRRCMILSFVAYICSFAIFWSSSAIWQLFLAMFFFAIGEAFRTGTHKAMILDWLRLQGREDEKTKTYGYTRSWSKFGSAVSALIAATLVFYMGRYSDIFLFTIVPYMIAILNFMGYPAELDGQPKDVPSLRNMAHHLYSAFRQAFKESRLRRILLESMSYESTFKVTKDYLQPTLEKMAIALPFFTVAIADPQKRTAVAAGCVYFVFFLASGFASRHADALVKRSGNETRAARRIWVLTAMVFLPIAAALWFEIFWAAVIGFVVLAMLQNLWRPITITRVDNETDASMGATVLSIESESKAVGTMVLAPLVGFAVDSFGVMEQVTAQSGQVQSVVSPALWVAGAAGFLITGLVALVPTMKPTRDE